jgi:hypothetical protein
MIAPVAKSRRKMSIRDGREAADQGDDADDRAQDVAPPAVEAGAPDLGRRNHLELKPWAVSVWLAPVRDGSSTPTSEAQKSATTTHRTPPGSGPRARGARADHAGRMPASRGVGKRSGPPDLRSTASCGGPNRTGEPRLKEVSMTRIARVEVHAFTYEVPNLELPATAPPE